MKKTLILIVVVIVVLSGFYYFFLAAPQSRAESERFVVSLGESRVQIIHNLAQNGFVKNSLGINLAFWLRGKFGNISPGGYKISKSGNVFKVAGALLGESYMKWVVVPEGLRKENLLQAALNWNDQVKDEFLNAYATSSLGNDYKEGVYFPDTYLLPKDETGFEIARRFINRFNEKFAPYADGFAKQDVKWTTALKIASLVERETGNASDMPLIAGIIWNRLLRGMVLQIDAAIQYARGDIGQGYWAPLQSGDLKINSSYNTYLHKGLPPTPISNPGLTAILAVLNPAKTDCLYYLHDDRGDIHCAATYAGHKINIEKYLK